MVMICSDPPLLTDPRPSTTGPASADRPQAGRPESLQHPGPLLVLHPAAEAHLEPQQALSHGLQLPLISRAPLPRLQPSCCPVSLSTLSPQRDEVLL